MKIIHVQYFTEKGYKPEHGNVLISKAIHMNLTRPSFPRQKFGLYTRTTLSKQTRYTSTPCIQEAQM